MKCNECGSILILDSNHEDIGRCQKSNCKMYNIPVKLDVI